MLKVLNEESCVNFEHLRSRISHRSWCVCTTRCAPQAASRGLPIIRSPWTVTSPTCTRRIWTWSPQRTTTLNTDVYNIHVYGNIMQIKNQAEEHVDQHGFPRERAPLSPKMISWRSLTHRLQYHGQHNDHIHSLRKVCCQPSVTIINQCPILYRVSQKKFFSNPVLHNFV